MHISVHHAGHGAGRLKRRIEAVADQAAELVAQHLGGTAPAPHVVLTNGSGLTALLHKADLDLLGDVARGRSLKERIGRYRHDRTCFGATALTRNGTLVAINGPRHRGNLRELDGTLLHEFAHVCQLARPDTRNLKITFMRMCYGLEPRDEAVRIAAYRQLDLDEKQAENLEVLARKLPAYADLED
ncbi:hypothetical protein ACIQVR_40940 [Streptomyces xanthochromogenes]|uniref:hypothetical protein n=1 Tax=Streptomyces xanthochromogenes TaxID=67384 RepID=UPI00382BD734